MNRITKVVTSSLLVAIALVATQASARSIPAAMGHPYVGSEQACFDATDFGIKNNGGTGCTSPRWYEIGVPYDNTNAGKTVTANASLATMQCFYTQVSATGVGIVTGTSGPMTVGTPRAVTVGFGDFGKVACRINAGQTWYGIQQVN